MYRKLMPIFVLLFLINCGGGGGGGDDPGPGPSNDPPVANFSATPLSGGAPLVVNFTSTSTNTTSHDWDFNGDNSLNFPVEPNLTKTLINNCIVLRVLIKPKCSSFYSCNSERVSPSFCIDTNLSVNI